MSCWYFLRDCCDHGLHMKMILLSNFYVENTNNNNNRQRRRYLAPSCHCCLCSQQARKLARTHARKRLHEAYIPWEHAHGFPFRRAASMVCVSGLDIGVLLNVGPNQPPCDACWAHTCLLNEKFHTGTQSTGFGVFLHRSAFVALMLP